MTVAFARGKSTGIRTVRWISSIITVLAIPVFRQGNWRLICGQAGLEKKSEQLQRAQNPEACEERSGCEQVARAAALQRGRSR